MRSAEGNEQQRQHQSQHHRREAAEENGLDAMRMISGAGHDAVFINDIIPTGMIFVPSIKGMSHCPQEDTKEEDLVKGVEMTADVLLKLDVLDI